MIELKNKMYTITEKKVRATAEMQQYSVPPIICIDRRQKAGDHVQCHAVIRLSWINIYFKLLTLVTVLFVMITV